MTRVSAGDGSVRIEFNHLWHRRAGDPLGGFALYGAASDAAEDEALAEIWSREDLPRPALPEPWTEDRVRRWIEDYHERFKDLTTMILAAGSSAELYEEGLPSWRRSFSMRSGRALAMDLVGDGSGAVLTMPIGYAPVWISVAEGSPHPWLELQATVTGPPMIVPRG